MKAIITCGGKGTRLLPFTKELPKEMAPIFSLGKNDIEIKPLIQQIFENLFTIGIREFCFISGKTKRSLQDHFYPDQQQDISDSLSSFYDKIIHSVRRRCMQTKSIIWMIIYQECLSFSLSPILILTLTPNP